MAVPQFKHIYGPVYSWRIGMSLGIDPLNTHQKYCNFDCAYCQLGSGAVSQERKIHVAPEVIVDELQALPEDAVIDYLTFSGNGEPTLAANLGHMIRAVKAVRPERVAVITNATTVIRPDVQEDLKLADLVLFKLDAPDQVTFEKMNRPAHGVRLSDIIRGIKEFKKTFEGRLALQIMFTEANKGQALEIAKIAKDINPDEVQLNTPLRPSAVKPLSREVMAGIKAYFTGLNVRSVYEEEQKAYRPFDDASTEKRHGKFRN